MLKISDLTASKNLDSKQMTDVRGGFYSYYSAWGYTGRSATAYTPIPKDGYSPSWSTSFGVINPDI